MYPLVQPSNYDDNNSKLIDYSNAEELGIRNAINNGDTLQFDTAKEADNYTRHYKDFGKEGFLLNIPYNINLPKPRLSLKNGGKIYIKPSHRGRFNALRERTGHSATWFKENGTPAQKKMAIFALNSSKWNN